MISERPGPVAQRVFKTQVHRFGHTGRRPCSPRLLMVGEVAESSFGSCALRCLARVVACAGVRGSIVDSYGTYREKHRSRNSVLAGAGIAATSTFGSAIVGRNAARPTLTIDRGGRAHVSYYADGRRVTLAAWGAINARTPSRAVSQVKFHIRYGEGGRGVCLPYDGRPLAWVVKECTAPDGSYWALQSWQRLKPNYGGNTGAWELHLSHWRGPLAQLVIEQNWAYGHVRHIFGRLTYDGQGVYGYKSTRRGDPLDGYGRNIYVDTFDSAYGKGWHRANSFLTHHRGRTPGDFCFAFYPVAGHPRGNEDEIPSNRRRPGSDTGRDVGSRRHRSIQPNSAVPEALPAAKPARPQVPRLSNMIAPQAR